MEEKVKLLETEALKELVKIEDLKTLADFKVKYIGKQGQFTALLRGMKEIPAEDRPKFGAIINSVRERLENIIEETEEKLNLKELERKLTEEKIDITEPAKNIERGQIHPLNKVMNKLMEACVEMGFTVVDGPEIETDYYNFEALNIPKDHPARDMQDSFYITQNLIMRSQTSAMQIRAMEAMKPPIKIVSPGRTYRADSDATHSPVFHQLEGLVVDENISMIDLKALLTKLLKMLFGENTQIRFRPSFFPFTEPSVEVDATCPMCGGKGCPRCKGSGFMELLGAGMVNPKVLENCGIDSKKYSGLAFGFGVDRFAITEYKVPSIRMMFENDIKFLSQIK